MHQLLRASALTALILGSGELAAQRRLNDPRDWVTSDDYPPVALSAKQQGLVILHYEISETGHVENCTVEQDIAAIPELIETTCRLVMQRARYAPGSDPSGQPKRTSDVAFVRWNLPPGATSVGETDFGGAIPTQMPFGLFSPDDLAPRSGPEHGQTIYAEFAITSDGRIEECELRGEQQVTRNTRGCSLLTKDARFQPPVDENGQPFATKGRLAIKVVTQTIRRVRITP